MLKSVDKCAAQCPFYTKRNTTCSTVVSLFESVERKLLDTMSANNDSNLSMAAVSSDSDFIHYLRQKSAEWPVLDATYLVISRLKHEGILVRLNFFYYKKLSLC